jgi:hypothetical protein
MLINIQYFYSYIADTVLNIIQIIFPTVSAHISTEITTLSNMSPSHLGVRIIQYYENEYWGSMSHEKPTGKVLC